jgi:hypothetical protein
MALIDPDVRAAGLQIYGKERQSGATTLQALTRTLEVNGKAATAMGVQQANGTQGLVANVNKPFRVLLENKLLGG